MKVQYINNIPIDHIEYTYPDLVVGNVYDVLDRGKNYYLLIGGYGKPYCHDTRRFIIVDAAIDDDWQKIVDEDGHEVFTNIFFNGYLREDYHDYKQEAIETFNRYVLRRFEKKHGKLEGIITHPLRNSLSQGGNE